MGFNFLCFYLFIVLLLCLLDPDRNCDHLFLKEGAGYFGFRHASHYENTPIQIYRKFHLQKLKIFR